MGVLNDLGQTVLPNVFAALTSAGLVDTMTIKRESSSKDSGGGTIKGSYADYKTNVPVSVAPIEKERTYRNIVGDKMVPTGRYTLIFPVNLNGSRISVDASTDRFVINARGNEPAKTFRINGTPRNKSGVVYEADCTFEG